MRKCYAILLATVCAIGYAQSNERPIDAATDAAPAEAGQEGAAETAPASVLPSCPTLDGIDAGVARAIASYCAAVLAAHQAAVHTAVTAAAAAVERDVQPRLAAAEAAAAEARRAHGACTVEGAILGAAVATAAALLHRIPTGP